MSFAFGASASSSPAPATGSFNFGGASTAPSFGSTSAPTAASTAFGAPAPASSFGGFPTAAAAPSPGTFGAFGATPAPSAFGFGGTPAFGAAPTPAFGGFGTTGSTTPQYGYAAPLYNTQQPQPVTSVISGSTPYAALSQDEKKAIDALHDAVMQHKRTMAHVETISPRLLSSIPKIAADCAAGDDLPITLQISRLEARSSKLQQLILATRQQVEELSKSYETSATQAIMHGKWPVEATATRRGVSLVKSKPTSEDNVQSKLQQLLDRQLAYVDRVERMPSPYLWQILEDLESRASNIQLSVETLAKQLDRYRNDSADPVDVILVIQLQHQALSRTLEVIAKLHQEMDKVRQRYRLVERGDNILDKADHEERDRERRIQEQVRIAFLQASSKEQATTTSAPPTAFGSTPAPAPTPFFGSGTTPLSAPAPSVFGAPANPPTTAPGGIFGNTTTPALATPNFGAPAQAPTPAFGAPAPLPGFLGATPGVPALFPTFGATSTTPKAKNKARGSTRRR